MGLVLSRKRNEKIYIGKNADIKITVADIRGDKVRLHIECDPSISINRSEVYDAIQREERNRHDRIQAAPDRKGEAAPGSRFRGDGEAGG